MIVAFFTASIFTHGTGELLYNWIFVKELSSNNSNKRIGRDGQNHTGDTCHGSRNKDYKEKNKSGEAVKDSTAKK